MPVPQRNHARQLTVATAVVAGLLVVVYFVLFLSVTGFEIGRSDFTGTYVGALLVRQGHGPALYSTALQAPLHASLIYPDTEGNLPFVNPPAAALVALPLSYLPLFTAYRVWVFIQVVLLAASLVLASSVAPWPEHPPEGIRMAAVFAAFALPGTMALVLLGQWDGLSALGIALLYWGERSDRRLLGWSLGAILLLLAKPHLALGIAALAIGRRSLPALAGAVVSAVVLGGSALLIGGTSVVGGFIHATLTGTSEWAYTSMLGATGLISGIVGNHPWVLWAGIGIGAVALVGCLVLGWWSTRRGAFEYALGGSVALSLFASPHLLGQDLVLLAPALVVALARAADDDFVPGWPGRRTTVVAALAAALLLAGVVDIPSVTPAGFGRVVPWVLIACGVAALVELRHRRGEPQRT